MLASIRRFAADVVKHAILGEAGDPSGDVQNVSLGRTVGVSDDCLVVVGHLRLPPRDCLVDGRLFMRFMVLVISLSPLVFDSSCGYAPYHYDLCGLPVFVRCEHRIAAPVAAFPSPSVPFLPRTNDARDRRAADRSQARCSTRAPQSSGTSPHPEFHGCFRWHSHLLSSGTTFLLFVHAAD